jgi:hypothetical protein
MLPGTPDSKADPFFVIMAAVCAAPAFGASAIFVFARFARNVSSRTVLSVFQDSLYLLRGNAGKPLHRGTL